MKRHFVIPISATVIVTAFFMSNPKIKPAPAGEENLFAFPKSENAQIHEVRHADAKTEIDRYIQDHAKKIKSEDVISLGITSHHLPTALPLIFNFYQSLENSTGPRETFVILAPDHLEKCRKEAVISKKSYSTPYGTLEIDQKLASDFLDAGIPDGKNCFEGDHSIGAQTIMIKKIFPDAKILPVVLSSSATRETEEKIEQLLWEKRANIFVLGSIDFSHHHLFAEAQMIDGRTQKIIEDLDGDKLTLENVDSPATAKIILRLANREKSKTIIIDRKNSYNFSGIDQDTTGYMSIIFTSD
jgi:AmmeMemoRadiSam system protein B